MKLLICLSLVFGYAYSQTVHGHDLNVLADNIFKALDANHDGQITDVEMDNGARWLDKNNDTHITCEEFTANSQLPHDLALEVFGHYDPDHDCEMTHADTVSVLKTMDQNGDNQVEMHEFEHFFTQIMKHLGHVDHSQHGK